MPSYATSADMRARYPHQRLVELTDDLETGGIDEGLVTRALEQADNLIDGYVARYYARADAALPVPGLLRDLACAIALYRLCRNGSPPEQVAADYKDAVSQLRDIAAGKLKLDLGEEVLPERDGQVLTFGNEPKFTRDGMSGW